VPQIEAIDSCGAGDTFTAAIAVYLHENIFNVNNIEKAINFAITASINVIKKEKTAITDIKI
jgi:sugar/nucleoside kinase (ribokinase family)